ncbi:MAG: PHP domain-containing protein, partial [Alphaproteobacteria bacterium]|nr:PHP domain-containing protein [Alphaproteobacteria bacterium]
MENIKSTLHTHTIGFDGQNTVKEMVAHAADLGFTTIGFSNHFIVHPNIKKSKMYSFAVQGNYHHIYSETFDEAINKFIPHYEEIEKIRSLYPQMRILRGMEVDFFGTKQWIEKFNQAIKQLKPDYLIGSTHFVELDGKILNSHDWAKADKETQKIILQKYWTNIAKAAQSNLFTWMAHLDLPKKVGLGQEKEWSEYERLAILAISKAKTAIEINTSFYKDDCYEPYPSMRILKMARAKNIPVI